MNIQEHNKCCIKCNDAGNCVYKDCFCHEGDSAMSGEEERLTYSGFMQVGEMIACGHCIPDKYVPTDPCTCKCHSGEVREKWEVEFERSYMNNGINGVLGDRFQDPVMLRIKDFIRQQRSLAQQEILDRVEKLIRDNAKDVLLIDGYMATVITIPHCRELLSTLKDTNI